ncbi:Uncharacterized protein Anas_06425 [Armadillidium nasatum]|uniref:Feline leukemia virus subgroup C receptor-related protein 2 n=1 Tax=Armadillidium nasatum TaxID=96803 RepID=A0A5N5TJV0_9CRUS|nr:Uncharacterized protein Anas_06425 [Armadillidium nasatum]
MIEMPSLQSVYQDRFLCANAQCFIIFMSTKISQCWFPESQRGICTTILATANPIGVVVAQISVPLIVEDADDIPLNDLVFLGVAIVNACIMFIFVRRSNPPTPPSYSADASKESRPPYLEQLKSAFTCFPLLASLVRHRWRNRIYSFTCNSHRTNVMSFRLYRGITIALMFLFGFCGAVVAAILLDRTKMYTEITIYFFGAAALSAIVLFEFFLVSDKEAVIIIFAILFGTFGVGLFPVGLELAVEATYPVEESITSAFIYLTGQIIGIVMILGVPALAFERADQTLSICSTDGEYAPLDLHSLVDKIPTKKKQKLKGKRVERINKNKNKKTESQEKKKDQEQKQKQTHEEE